MNASPIDWNAVHLVVLMGEGPSSMARVFAQNGDEWWCLPGQNPQFVGQNEPPDFGEHKKATGTEARDLVQQFLGS